MSVPKEMNFQVPSLSKLITSQSYVNSPSNGSSFTSGQELQINLISNTNTYLIPESMYLQFRININGVVANENTILGIPACAVWSRSNLFASGANIESINNYGAITQALLHSKLNASQKQGLSNALGLKFTEGNSNLVDSYSLSNVGNNPIECAVPLCNALTNCSRYVPIGMAQFQLYLTVEELANFCVLSADGGSAITATGFSIDNIELHYKCVTLDPETNALVLNQGGVGSELKFKTQSYGTTVAQIAQGSSGAQAINFASSYTSLKSLWCLFCQSGLYKYNASYDITNGSGTIQWVVAGSNWPARSIDTRRRGSVYEFLEAIHGVNVSPESVNTCMSVNNYLNSTSGFGDTSIKDLPKAYYGVSVEKISSSYMMSGITTMNSPVELRFNIDGNATNTNVNVLQVFNYDMVLVYNPASGDFYTMR